MPSTLADKPYNDLQIGTFIGFGVTYFVATLFLVFRYMQAFKITKKVELDLSKCTIHDGSMRQELTFINSYPHDIMGLSTGVFHHHVPM